MTCQRPHSNREPTSSTSSVVPTFPEHERLALLRTPGISHGVVERIEGLGICSARELLDRGIDALVDEICRDEGSLVWRNRRRALTRAMAALSDHIQG
jgi:hypothetical protein